MDGTYQVAVDGTLPRSSSRNSHYDIPSPPPQGGSGQAPEAVARPSLIISEEVIRNMEGELGRDRTLAELRKGNHPIPEWLLVKEKTGEGA